MSKPHVPKDNPLYEFCIYTISEVAAIKTATMVLGIVVAVLALGVLVVLVNQWIERRERKKTRELIKTTLEVVAKFNAITDARTVRVGGEIKEAIQEVPAKVVQKIDEKAASESGSLKAKPA